MNENLTCKDNCIHYGVCKKHYNEENSALPDLFDLWLKPEICSDFKNEANFVELPCKVGDTVYQIYELFNEKIMEELKVVELTFDIKGIKTLYGTTAKGSTYGFVRNYNLDQIKFTKEETEQALRKTN